jgi:hypothetical protein
MGIRARAWIQFAATGVSALLAGSLAAGCSDASKFQPVAFGARPWTPPAGWDPEPPCVVGYYVAITTCEGCSGISYALCDGDLFSQCTCGTAFAPGDICPQTFACAPDDYPPQNWQEFTDYAGPGWAGLTAGDAGDGG